MPHPTPDERAALFARLPRKIAAGGVVIRDAAGRVLLVEPTYKRRWQIPGGVVEAGESPRGAAARECREELGRDITVGALLVIDFQVGGREGGDSYQFVFDGGVLAADSELRLPPDELSSYRWVAPPDLDRFLGRRLAARVRAALAALDSGAVVELVDSELVG